MFLTIYQKREKGTKCDILITCKYGKDSLINR